jgi:serine-protein kinase ATM
VDGMGPLGIEGIFRKAAEATLAALKENKSALKVIVSAIVSDPLYKWSINSFDNSRKQKLDMEESRTVAKKVRRSAARGSSNLDEKAGLVKNDDDDENDTKEKKNEAAAHVIRKIQEKLQGYEDGTSGEQQSVEGQVSLLINSARDFDNLCAMFPGWAPWV